MGSVAGSGSSGSSGNNNRGGSKGSSPPADRPPNSRLGTPQLPSMGPLFGPGLLRVSFEYRTDHSKRPLVVEMEGIILAKMEIITKTRPKGPLVVSNLFNLYPKLIIKC